jgi:hypothetical protein
VLFRSMDVEVVNWRAIMGAPGITAEQRKSLTDTFEKMVQSKEWAEVLKSRGWDDYFLAGEPFAAFLKEEQSRVGEVLQSVGLVKSCSGMLGSSRRELPRLGCLVSVHGRGECRLSRKSDKERSQRFPRSRVSH